MRKILGNLSKVLLGLLVLILVSCGSKKVATTETSVESNNSNILTTEKISPDSDSNELADEENTNEQAEQQKLQEQQEEVNQVQQSDIQGAYISAKLDFFDNKEKKLLFKLFIPNKSKVYSPLENDNIYIIKNVIPIEMTAFEYYKMFFKNYEIVGFSLFDSNKKLSIKNIKKIAQMKGANTVIIKKVYNNNKDLYIYDIVYLNGSLNTTFFWNRSSEEAIPVNTTLRNLPVKENTNKYSLESILKVKIINSPNNNDSANNQINVLQSLDNNISDINKIIVNKSDNNQSTVDGSNKSSATFSEMEKIRERINNLVGLWMDSHDKSIIEIKEVPAKVMVSKDNITRVNSQKIKYYAAYIVFNSAKKQDNYNSYEKINTSTEFKWKHNDLKFQFNSSGKNSVYLNYDKMPQVAMVRPFHEKGVLMVSFPNGEIRYYIPLGVEVSSKFIKKLYKNLPTHIEGKEMSVGKNPNYGSGMYGWLVSTGVILLTLGLLSVF